MSEEPTGGAPAPNAGGVGSGASPLAPPELGAGGQTVLAVDPGRAKCGVVVAAAPERPGGPVRVLARAVVATERLTVEAAALRRRFPQVTLLLVGDGTGGAVLRRALQAALPDLPVRAAPEHGTSVLARARFLAENRAPGWRRLLPPGLRAPERPYDDYVALILAEAYFGAAFSKKIEKTFPKG